MTVSPTSITTGLRALPLRRIAFYAALALLAAVAMSEDAFTAGLWMLVIPGLFLALAQWAFIYLPLIDWPLTAWRRTRKVRWVAVWLCLGAIIPLWAPLAINLTQMANAAIVHAGDELPAAPAKVNGPILFAGDCGDYCSTLVATGALPEILRNDSSPFGKRSGEWRYGEVLGADRIFASTYCERDRRGRLLRVNDDGWCLISTVQQRTRVGAVVALRGFSHTRGARDRLIEVWTCPDRCQRVARQSEVHRSLLALPLRIHYARDQYSVDPQFARTPLDWGSADFGRTLQRTLGLPATGSGPTLGEDPDLQRRLDEARQRQKQADGAS